MTIDETNAVECRRYWFAVSMIRRFGALVVAALMLERLILTFYLGRTEVRASGTTGLVLAAIEQDVVGHHHALRMMLANGGMKVDKIELKPAYSTVEIPGKCIKCLAEQEYGNCLRQLLRGEQGKRELEERFEALLALLKSADLAKLRDESEKLLANGKEVKITINSEEGKPRYEIKAD